MPLSDAFLVGEDWISEAYFTSDATKQSFLARVIERRKDWEGRKESNAESPLTRFSAVRGDLTALLIRASDENSTEEARRAAAAEAADLLEAALGFRDAGRSCHRDGPITRVQATDIEKDVVALVRAAPVDSIEDLLSKETGRLAEAWVDEDGKEIAQAPARALSAVFADPDAPAYALVFAGRWALVAERTRWAEGRYLAVDLQLVLDRNETKRGGEVDSIVAAIHSESFVPEADGTVWWDQTLDDSVKHTVGVSQDLREGIRHSIEVIANEVVNRRAARGLEPLPAEQAQPLAIQSLRFLYRILFLLFAEASPELEVLPVNAADYERGYSLDRLRELVQVKIETPRAKAGTHFYESLAVLFRLVDKGHSPTSGDASESDGLTFNALRADLFKPEATALIDEVGLGNAAMQQVLDRLLLSRAQSGKQRGFISYAELGINQLGAVYEGLMSYTGFFATEPLYEVAPNGDSSKGSWVVPVSRVDATADGEEQWIQPHFVLREDEITGAKVPVRYDSGEFVFRLAGRERQQSASYYTPEVLTRFTVSQALEELLDQDGKRTSAEEILQLTVCEPALGSGAFAIEAARQLAEQYLARRQEELGERVDPEEYPRQLQRVKAYIALHQVYGVDLNATAVELAEISLWLDTMAPGLHAPWFGLHLRRGNSLVGARRAVYSRDQVASKSWLTATPREVPLSSEAGINGAIHHFLLPALGWGSAVEAKEGKTLAPDDVAALKAWRRSITARQSKKQVEALQELAHRVEALWDLSRRRLAIADREIRRAIPLWGREADEAGIVTREQIEASLADEDGAYRRLRRVMDAWNALWFWPLSRATTDGVAPPTLEDWIDACQRLLGRHREVKARAAAQGQTMIGLGSDWTALEDEERLDLGFAGATSVEDVLTMHPWLRVCDRVAGEHGFFHWEVEFAPVFRRGGFDLQVGNPPWVRPKADTELLMAEADPWWKLAGKRTEVELKEHQDKALSDSGVRALLLESTGATAATSSWMSDRSNFPELSGQTDLYRVFMSRTWSLMAPQGVVALIHPDSHLTDIKTGVLRSHAYQRLRRHWHFENALRLFEIGGTRQYAVNVYGSKGQAVSFLSASALRPETIAGSLVHNGDGPVPGERDDDNRWDLRSHAQRILTITPDVLRAWSDLLESTAPHMETPMVFLPNAVFGRLLARMSTLPRFKASNFEFSPGWHERDDKRRGRFDVDWGRPESADDVILQGVHIRGMNPRFKYPRETLKSKGDWVNVDLERLGPTELPVTSFKPRIPMEDYRAAYDKFSGRSALDFYRIAWRNMVAKQTERALMPALIPPKHGHVDGIYSMGGDVPATLLASAAGQLSSMLSDFLVRVVPKSTIRSGTIARLPLVVSHPLDDELVLRVLRLNCVTSEYADLWAAAWRPRMAELQWTGGLDYPGRRTVGAVEREWTPASALRIASDRRQAQVEIDCLVALMFDVSIDDLCNLYATQFAILRKYDRVRDYFDRRGRLVPTSVLAQMRTEKRDVRGGSYPHCNEDGFEYVYEAPFRTLDRESDMRQAYAWFERVMQERS
ncbi:class I SAM-dependent DNA methyltransferase [Desertivibrio insolitus]|uniref:class I SAM-dependent DNA methyltransferase n=1 Tax=Herbiconiux sp. SYSU D00978 TaxID=2812562 RepID=UPI001A97AEE1|nr:class I SAM-dependent DNA methyltransferase [Herbiconiux sp. SYSU D00978]